MRTYVQAVQALRSQGWSWARAAAFVLAEGPRMALVSVRALQGIEERHE